jgi:hypothetical protein
MINLEILQGYFEKLGLTEEVSICINGQEAIDCCLKLINEALMDTNLKHHVKGTVIKPISLCLLDF